MGLKVLYFSCAHSFTWGYREEVGSPEASRKLFKMVELSLARTRIGSRAVCDPEPGHDTDTRAAGKDLRVNWKRALMQRMKASIISRFAHQRSLRSFLSSIYNRYLIIFLPIQQHLEKKNYLISKEKFLSDTLVKPTPGALSQSPTWMAGA